MINTVGTNTTVLPGGVSTISFVNFGQIDLGFAGCGHRI
jgi:hypothetical protein